MPAFAGMTDVNWTPNYVTLYLHYPQTMKERNMRLIIIVEKPPVFGQSAAYRGRLFLDTRPSRDDQFTWQSDVGGEWIRIGRRGFGPASWTLDPSLHASAGFSGVMRCFETHIDEQSQLSNAVAIALGGFSGVVFDHGAVPRGEGHGRGSLLYSANPAFQGEITWQIERVCG